MKSHHDVAQPLAGVRTPLTSIKRFEITCINVDPDATVDIVLVHGLNGHLMDTWKANNGVFWPQDLLPLTLKKVKARIVVYGYNADVSSFGSDMSPSSDKIHHLAQTLLAARSMQRMPEERDGNAIIWVAHNLGGVLLKRAWLL